MPERKDQSFLIDVRTMSDGSEFSETPLANAVICRDLDVTTRKTEKMLLDVLMVYM